MNRKACAVEGLGDGSMELGLNEIGNDVHVCVLINDKLQMYSLIILFRMVQCLLFLICFIGYIEVRLK